ncbi:TetR/AcrR family transcriptional regulator C-terminal domain-containing protein [Sinomonas sp. JGH33]|uniref:TetR/AcrR family transcriptional regulator C-terminal domain-containing protein n=1 Tax=Sinomonas terricola TaxID=3110330 RepID=A0ABU5T651_9MICC|nr:hypothetical protein [Sinomonas sp. JGH33]MEA5455145.1 TetR/AcrR family transcriptional regulator C-terminal domain-containing protein [Sinomonas sp. JGH33]
MTGPAARAADAENGEVHRLGRPRVPRLSLERIGHEALAMLEEEGTLSLPRLAERLGVRQSAFYKHVSGRAEIVELARGALAERAPLPEPAADFAELVRGTFHALRGTYQSVPALLPLILTQPVSNPAALAIYDRLAAAFGAAGVSGHLILPAIEAIDSAAIGAALDSLTIEAAWQVPPGKAASFPHLVAAQEALAARSVDRFAFLAETLAAGLASAASPDSPEERLRD